MTTAADILDPDALVVSPQTSVQDLATLLLDRRAEGACVVEDGRLVGVVTAMDLVFREKNIHLPTFFTFMEAVIPLGLHKAEEEVQKVAGLTVQAIMSPRPVTVGPAENLHAIATLMVEKHLSMIPVVDHGKLLGAVDKRAVLEAAFKPPAG